MRDQGRGRRERKKGEEGEKREREKEGHTGQEVGQMPDRQTRRESKIYRKVKSPQAKGR